MATERKRYRAFISYSQRDKATARRLHRALETYRVPAGVNAALAADRRLGRFFRDDEEMGASQSLGAALEGAIDDAENLIVICTPAAAQSKWVDAEVRRFKTRRNAKVFAVIAAGKPNAEDPAQECFPPALKVRIDSHGRPTDQPDEPRAPDLQREGLPRVRAQLAAGLLDVPFDDLWQRDRRRTRRRHALSLLAVVLVGGALAAAGLGWLGAQRESRIQAAQEAVTLARNAAAEGRVGESLARLAPYLQHEETRVLAEAPLRALLGWIPDPYEQLASAPGSRLARLRDATVLIDPERGVSDVSDVGTAPGRLIRARDGRRLILIGDQRTVVADAQTGERLAELDNAGVDWLGHSFEAPNGTLIVSGAVMGPTNGSVRPYVMAVSPAGDRVHSEAMPGPMFFGSAAGVTKNCSALLFATEGNARTWAVEAREFGADGLGEPVSLRSLRAASTSETAGARGLASFGHAFASSDGFLGEAQANPFTRGACLPVASDEGFEAGTLRAHGVRAVSLEPDPSDHRPEIWTAATGSPPPGASRTPLLDYRPSCTEQAPCPIIGGGIRTESYVRDEFPPTAYDTIGPPPAPRWSRPRKDPPSSGRQLYFEHIIFNSGHRLTICRPAAEGSVCLQENALGEDQWEQAFVRSPDGRHLFWPFAGTVYDLDTLQALTEARAVPITAESRADFEIDRPGLIVALDGRLLAFTPDSDGRWTRADDERASPLFSVLGASTPGSTVSGLHTLASLGQRQYLVVRNDGGVARIDVASGRELWRFHAGGVGELKDVQLNEERTHLLLMGTLAWRLFRLADGFPLSALMVPPPMLERRAEVVPCTLGEPLGTNGTVVARCQDQDFIWQPQDYEGDFVTRIARLTCAADVRGSALETIRRCYVRQ